MNDENTQTEPSLATIPPESSGTMTFRVTGRTAAPAPAAPQYGGTTPTGKRIAAALAQSAAAADEGTGPSRTTRKLLAALAGIRDNPNRRHLYPFPAAIFIDFSPVTSQAGLGHTTFQGKLAPYTPETIAALTHGAEFASEQEVTRLREIQKSIDELNSEMENWSLARANNKFHSQARELFANWNGNGSQVPPALQIQTREALQNSYNVKRRAIEHKMEPLYAEAAELAGPIIGAAMKHISNIMAEMEEGERHHSDSYAIPWVPTHLWRCCAKIVIDLDSMPSRRQLRGSPRSLLRGIIAL